VVGREYSWRGPLPFSSIGLLLLALGASQVVISWCILPTHVVGLCHPRGRRYKHSGVRVPFSITVKASVSDPLNRRPVCWFLVPSVLITVVLDNCM
jgi:hypothetical protein